MWFWSGVGIEVLVGRFSVDLLTEECMYGRSVGKARDIWLFDAGAIVHTGPGKSVHF
jgi:hypothetical protein